MFNNIPPVTKLLIIINAFFFVAKNLLTAFDMDILFGAFYPASVNFHPYQIVTHMFMHGNLAHFGFNMFSLWSFGAPIENYFGKKRYLIYYFLCGFGSFALFNLVNYFSITDLHNSLVAQGVSFDRFDEFSKLSASVSMNNQLDTLFNGWMGTIGKPFNQSFANYFLGFTTPMMGASGAIFGVLIAFGMLYPNAKMMMIFLPIPIKAKYMMIFYILFELYLGVQNAAGDNVAHFAHIGGALIGFILIKLWKVKSIY